MTSLVLRYPGGAPQPARGRPGPVRGQGPPPQVLPVGCLRYNTTGTRITGTLQVLPVGCLRRLTIYQSFYISIYVSSYLFLSIQAAMFYLPRFIWKSYEGGVMKLLTNGLMGKFIVS